HATTFVEQPRLEPRGGGEVHAGEKLLSQSWNLRCFKPALRGQHPHVDVSPGGERHRNAISLQRIALTDESSELGEVPAERTERVVRLGEQQRSKVLPSDRS